MLDVCGWRTESVAVRECVEPVCICAAGQEPVRCSVCFPVPFPCRVPLERGVCLQHAWVVAGRPQPPCRGFVSSTGVLTPFCGKAELSKTNTCLCDQRVLPKCRKNERKKVWCENVTPSGESDYRFSEGELSSMAAEAEPRVRRSHRDASTTQGQGSFEPV